MTVRTKAGSGPSGEPVQPSPSTAQSLEDLPVGSTVVKRRRQRASPRGELRRVQIVEAATDEFTAKGYRSASLASIAERVGITQSGLLHHYPTKDALLAAVLAARSAADVRVMEAAGFDPQAPLSAYSALAELNTQDRSWVQFLTVVGAEGLTEDHPAREVMARRLKMIRGRSADRMASSKDGGHAYATFPQRELLAAILVGAMDGLQLHWLYDPSVDVKGGMELLAEMVMAVHAPPNPGERPRGPDHDHDPVS